MKYVEFTAFPTLSVGGEAEGVWQKMNPFMYMEVL
jgi:hypothetical protein